jgi:hypothetical protein
MRMLMCLASGLAAAGLVGCTSVSSQLSTGTNPASTVNPAVSTGVTSPQSARANSGSTPTPTAKTSTAAAAPPVSPTLQASARSTATEFYARYSAGQFAAAWSLLSPATRSQVSKSVWVSVHSACPGSAAGKSRVIKAVTAFGSAAIVTEAIVGSAAGPGTAEDVFNYVNGQWGYSPGEVNIYRHSSASADIAAAQSAGFCIGWKVF